MGLENNPSMDFGTPYVFATVRRDHLSKMVDELKRNPAVLRGSLLAGRYDIVIRPFLYGRWELYNFINNLRKNDYVRSTSTYVVFDGFSRPVNIDNLMLAYCLIRTQGLAEEALEATRKMESVVEAHVVSGDWDMIAVVTGKTDEEALKNAIEGFEDVPGVRKTETMTSYRSFSCALSQKL